MAVSEQERLSRVYQARNEQEHNRLYSVFNSTHLYMQYQRQKSTIEMLKATQMTNLENKTVLEVGCGYGDVLCELMGYGLLPQQLVGIDLLLNRAQHAHQRYPHLVISQADAMTLPFPNAAFDVVVQHTVFSSILADTIKQAVAQEMKRVLKPKGFILWYDFWLNPTNPDTRGIRPQEIKRLFGHATYDFKKITLAPPLARTLVPRWRLLADMLEMTTLLNTHYLALIQPQ